MIYVFEPFELNATKVELTRAGEAAPLEPQVYALLLLLVENRDRLVSKDEIIEKIWDGRAVSDSALSSRIKTLRKALGDDGSAQRMIRTIHGRGFRFVSPVTSRAAAAAVSSEPQRQTPFLAEAPGDAASSRPSIAVLPFERLGQSERHGVIAEAIPHELILALSRLRWLFVIARGSSFRFRSAEAAPQQIGEALGARYVLSGSVEMFGAQVAVSAELADARDGGVVWGERYAASVDDIHALREDIVAKVIAALEIQIPLNEARLASPENLDAWSAYHLGLRYMHRFNRTDNAAAAALFQTAIERETGFARAHAGLSFTHFQNAFLRYTGDDTAEVEHARRCAERAVELDPLDSFANFNLGRSFWLTGDLEGGRGWLERATDLSPSFAQGVYARGWTDAVTGRGEDSRRHLELAMRLSPLDPFRYAMLGSRALALLGEGADSEAAEWGERAGLTPGAHFLIGMIASAAHGLNDDPEAAERWARRVRERRADASRAHFFRAFPFAQQATRERLSAALERQGF